MDMKESLTLIKCHSFINNTGHFDYVKVDKWKPSVKYYLRKWLSADRDVHIIDLVCGEGRILHLL